MATNSASPVKALLSSLVKRSAFARKAGFQFAGKRDVFKAAGYPPQDGIQFADYWAMYRRNELASRIIELPAKTTWRKPPEVREAAHQDPPEKKKPKPGDVLVVQSHKKLTKKQSPFEHEFFKLAERLRLWHYMSRTDILAGIGRYSGLLFVVKGVDDAGLKLPMKKVTGPEAISTLVPYSEGNCEIKELDEVPGPHFGQPLYYDIRLFGDTEGGVKIKGGNQRLQVHWTRVLHVAENKVEDEIYGTPRIERVFNRLFDVDKISASVGETYWQAAGSRVLQATMDENAEISEPVLDLLEEQLTEIVHDLRRQFYSKGVKLEWLHGEAAPVKDIGDFYFSLIAVGCGIPKRILMGSELGELASSTDQQTFFGMINERQEQFAEPEMLRPFINRLIDIGALTPPSTGEYEIQWPTLFKESDKERATANAQTAAAAQSLSGIGGDPLMLVEVDDDGKLSLMPRAPGSPGEPFSELTPNAPEAEDPEIAEEENTDDEGTEKEAEAGE